MQINDIDAPAAGLEIDQNIDLENSSNNIFSTCELGLNIPNPLRDKGGTSVCSSNSAAEDAKARIARQIREFFELNGCLPSRRQLQKLASCNNNLASQVLSGFRAFLPSAKNGSKNDICRSSLDTVIDHTRNKIPHCKYSVSDQMLIDDSVTLLFDRAKDRDVYLVVFDIPSNAPAADIEICRQSDKLLTKLMLGIGQLINVGDYVLRWERKRFQHLHLNLLISVVGNPFPSESELRKIWTSVLPQSAFIRQGGGTYTTQQTRVSVTSQEYFNPYSHDHVYLAKRTQTRARYLEDGSKITPQHWYAISPALQKLAQDSVQHFDIGQLANHEIEDYFNLIKELVPHYRCKERAVPFGKSNQFHGFELSLHRSGLKAAKNILNEFHDVMQVIGVGRSSADFPDRAVIELRPYGRLTLKIKRKKRTADTRQKRKTRNRNRR